MALNIIIHNNKKVVELDYKTCKNKEEMIELAREAADYFKTSQEQIRALSDFTGTHGSTDFMAEIKKLSKEVFRVKTEKAAALGINGIKKVLLNGYNSLTTNKIEPFDSKEQALDYLTS